MKIWKMEVLSKDNSCGFEKDCGCCAYIEVAHFNPIQVVHLKAIHIV